jgi:cell wall-associated NlpC family hydrolase
MTKGTSYYNNALEFVGVPYKLGGIDKTGIDCSGLVNAATGQKTRVWTTSSGGPPPLHSEIVTDRTSHDNFIASLKKGDILLWKGHAAFYDEGIRIFHARKPGTVAGFTNDLKTYWLKVQGYPVVFRAKI